jgi:hypothetical protein
MRRAVRVTATPFLFRVSSEYQAALLLRRRRATAPNASKLNPNNAVVPGSGTETGAGRNTMGLLAQVCCQGYFVLNFKHFRSYQPAPEGRIAN